jgi:hypothetical protein
MKEYCACEDGRLISFLDKSGFYVVPRARSNYDRTEFSVGSTLSMDYIDAVPNTVGKNFESLNLFCRIMQDSAVRRLLKRLGYTTVNISSSTSATDWIYVYDKNLRCTPLNNFVVAFSLLTPLYATEQYLPLLRDLEADMRLRQGDCLKEVAAIPGPKFVFLHTHIAHAPSLFDESGKKLPLPPGQFMVNWGTPKELCGQWKYSQSVLIEWLTQIMQMTDRKAIVMVQSDHGSGLYMAKPEDWYNERMRILNAYYFPGQQNKGLYPNITPINSFRVLFNDYFDAKLPMLKDVSRCAPDYGRAFYWEDVSNRLRFPK